jgi:Flp pilus assembly protein TadD
MAKKRKPTRKRHSESAPVLEKPVFWFGFDVAWAKLVTARAVIFALLALDALLQIRHAPRYGAGGFNVAQIPGLTALGPGRVGYGVGQLLDAYLLVLVACGVATRIALPAAAAIYAWLYFGSQLDSYQHHYLVALLLAIACFVPWQRPRHARAATRIRSWALRLILVQLAILYLWAAISKLSPAWLDGSALETQIGGTLRSVVDHTIGLALMSKLVVVTEFALAATVWIRPAWWFAAPVGILFHLGIVFTGLEIGLFAWLMIAFYLLVIPDVIFVRVAERVAELFRRRPPPSGQRAPTEDPADADARPLGWGWLAAAVLAGAVLAFACRIQGATAVGLLLGAFPIALAIRAPRTRSRVWLGVAHVLALALWLAVDHGTTVTTDYARLWGGASKRLGDLDTAERAYRRLVELTPDDPGAHLRLGRVLLERDSADAGLAELHTAEQMEPSAARAWLEEARWLQRHGRIDDAITKAREATYAEPRNADARQLLGTLSGTRTAPGGANPPSGPAAPGARSDSTDDERDAP